ncbi:extracellular calcium-sensing receptor-like [Pelobates fuscus]|uniref:extracellular calcium-sensing receptor-like n=1 Tax=Pelobates fuscus TaxID=191477 RepID=UPI002FE4DCF7
MRLMTHFYLSLWHLVLSYFVPTSNYGDLRCQPSTSSLPRSSGEGDILIGAVLPFYVDMLLQKITFTEKPPEEFCTTFLVETYKEFQAIKFAIEEVNSRVDLLPNIALGFQVYNTCAVMKNEMLGTLLMLTGQTQAMPNYCCKESPLPVAVIGHSLSTTSILMAHILGLYRYPQPSSGLATAFQLIKVRTLSWPFQNTNRLPSQEFLIGVTCLLWISHYSTSSVLSDRTQFPSFFRTVPSDNFQSNGLAKLLIHFGWTWVGLIAAGNDYGLQGMQVIKQEIIKAGYCVAFTELILFNRVDKNIAHLTKVIRESTAKVVVIFSSDISFALLLNNLLSYNVTGRTFVASETWSTSNILLAEKYKAILAGSIGFAFHSSAIPGFKEYLSINSVRKADTLENKLHQVFWQKMFECKFLEQNAINGSLNNFPKICTGKEELNSINNVYTDMSNLRSSYNAYTSVHVIAKSLHDLYTCHEGRGPFYNKSCANIKHFKAWQLGHYLQNVRVNLSNGRHVSFDRNGDLPAVYDIVNWQLGAGGVMKQIKVGSYDSTAPDGNIFMVNTSAIMWNSGMDQVPVSVCRYSCPPGFRKTISQDKPPCCFQCVPCAQGEVTNQTDLDECFKCPMDMWPNLKKEICLPKVLEFLSYKEPLGATLSAMSVTSSAIPISILGLFLQFKNTPIVKASNYSLSCLLLLSISLCFLCSLNFIGYPNTERCLARQVTFGMVFTICISCILAKTIMVVFAFMATKPDSSLRRWTDIRVSYMIVFLCSLIQFILCLYWIIVIPPFPEKNTQIKPDMIIYECNEGSPIAFWCMLGYLGLLSTISFIVAFFARRLPDSFNEAKFITFSMLAFLSVWVSYIPASLSSSGQYVMAMEVFAIFSSSWALVICMFIPKCVIILFKPTINSREKLMVKDRDSMTKTCTENFH